VVATDTCAVVGDLVIDDETGFVTKVGDFDMLTDRVAKLGLDEDIRRRFEKQVHAKIARWGPDQSALGFASACVEVARGDR
jgi:glycosyltransferase involved in cell wall biosynthesis